MKFHEVLTRMGFKRDVMYPGCNTYERHSGAFALRVVHVPSDDTVRLHIAYRSKPGQPPMPYRSWGAPLPDPLTPEAVAHEVSVFLRAVEPEHWDDPPMMMLSLVDTPLRKGVRFH